MVTLVADGVVCFPVRNGAKPRACGPARPRIVLVPASRSKTAASATLAVLTTQTGGTDSASGGSGGSGMECLQLRSPPGPFHYLMTEQAKSLQELQNEVGALLEFRDLVIETFPNLRSKMAPSTPASGVRRDWEPGVRVRRKLANGAGETTRAKPQPSVQDSGFSTETSCGKDAHSSSASASASATRSRPLEDELWALLDVIQRKGTKLRDEAELLRGELDGRHSPSSENVEESFARALSAGCLECECADTRRLRKERDELLLRSAELEAQIAAQKVDASPTIPGPAAASSPATPNTLGHLDNVLGTPSRLPVVRTPNSKKFAAILHESNPVELQRHLLTSTVQSEILSDRLRRAADQRTMLRERLERAREENEDLKFQLEEKTIELEGTKAKVRMLQGKKPQNEGDSEVDARSRDRERDSMRDMEPLHIPDEEPESKITETPRRSRPSKIPLHTAGHKGLAPKPPTGATRSGRDSVSYRSRSGESPARPPSSHSCRSVASVKSRRDSYVSAKKDSQSAPAKKTQVPVRRASQENKVRPRWLWNPTITNWWFKDNGSS